MMSFLEKPVFVGLVIFAIVSGAVYLFEKDPCPWRAGMTYQEAGVAMGKKPTAMISPDEPICAYFRDGRIVRVVDNRPTRLRRWYQLLCKVDPDEIEYKDILVTVKEAHYSGGLNSR